MRGEWCYTKSYFSSDFCDDIVKRAKTLELKNAGMGFHGNGFNDDYRRSKVGWLQPSMFPELYEEMWKLEREINSDWFNFSIDNSEFIQFSEYNSQNRGEYKKHQDVFWLNNTPKHRKLTAVVQLTDPNEYTGCELTLYNCEEYPNPEEIKQQGTVIFFPSFVFHSVSPIESGVRNSLAMWFDGPKWR